MIFKSFKQTLWLLKKNHEFRKRKLIYRFLFIPLKINHINIKSQIIKLKASKTKKRNFCNTDNSEAAKQAPSPIKNKHIKSGFCMFNCPSAHFISLHVVRQINVERVIFFVFYAYLRDSLQISLLILNRFKRINQLLFP